MRVGSLKTTLAAWFSALVVLVLLANATYLVMNTRALLRQRLEENARLFARVSTEPLCRAYDSFSASGSFRFRQIAEDVLRQSPDVTGIAIADVTGRVLFHSRELGARGSTLTGSEPGRLEALRELELHEFRGTDESGEYLDVVAPWVEDFGRHRLSVVYRVSYANVVSQSRRSTLATLALTVVSLAVASGLGIALARRVTRPLATLTAGVGAIARGQYDRRLDVRSGDELQVVAEAFNDMAGRLQSTVAELRRSLDEREGLITELERRNAELERFTYTVSHDLRSPLVTVTGFLGAIEKAAEQGRIDRVREDVARISAAAERMDRLLRELLELSRVGRVARPPSTVRFADLVEEARTLVAGQLARHGVRLEVAPDLPSVCGDRQRLVEVVQNLLDNAARFMGDQPHPLVRVTARTGDGGQAVFCVSDNGIGIEPRHQALVFGLFERLDPSVEGTGVGLALVRRIVEVHGGRVWVESEGLGRGSTFCLTLPTGGRDGQPCAEPVPLPSASTT